MKKHVKLTDGFYLTRKTILAEQPKVEVAKKTNHIFVVDVSGSMYYDLPKIRTQLKNKLSSLMKEGDTISIVWFSGRNEAGILKEEVEVKSLKTLSDLNNAIDRWLQPVGLTAFLKPLDLVKGLIERVKSNRPDSVFSMIFLTDGYNNDCPWQDVISTLKSMENDITSSTFVEYGYYADTQKLTQMATLLGGEKISCDGFDDFEPIFDAKITSSNFSSKKVLAQIEENYLYDFAFSVNNGSVILYSINEGEVLIPENVNNVYYFTPQESGENIVDDYQETMGALYAAVYVLSDKLLNEDAEKVFYVLGDNFHYRMLTNAFGKQKLNSFKAAIKECVGDVSKRFPEGVAPIKPVADDTYCLMDLINDLTGDVDVMFYPGHPKFNYSRIGRKRIVKGNELSDVDKKRLNEAKNVEEAQKILEELKDKKVDLKFVYTEPNKGYSLKNLVWNEERANLSVLVRYDGVVELPVNKFGIDKVSSFRFNTYTVIKDGIVNIQTLPVNHTPELVELLNEKGVAWELYSAKDAYDQTILIDLTSIPVINRKMVKSVSAEELAKLEWELKKLQGDKKVYDYYKKELFPKTSKSYADMLGEECAAWLKEIGITDYNGFAPKTDAAEATDFYMSVNLATKIKGLSSLPKVVDVWKKIQDGKTLKLNEWVMADAVKKYHEQLQSDMFQTLSEEQQKGVLETYLNTKYDILNKKKKSVMQEIAQIKFALILSKKWFKEFQSFDENVLKITLDGQDLQFTFDLSEKEVKV
ncbi:MAG: VWA domain-containing protein [bacterium]